MESSIVAALTADPTLVPELTVTQWFAADIAERVLRRALDERRLLQGAASSTAAEHQATATAAMAAALLAQAPIPQSQDSIVTELVAAQVMANKPPDVLSAVMIARVIRQLAVEPRIYPSPT